MRRFFSLLLALPILFSLVGCNASKDETPPMHSADGYRLRMYTRQNCCLSQTGILQAALRPSFHEMVCLYTAKTAASWCSTMQTAHASKTCLPQDFRSTGSRHSAMDMPYSERPQTTKSCIDWQSWRQTALSQHSSTLRTLHYGILSARQAGTYFISPRLREH